MYTMSCSLVKKRPEMGRVPCRRHVGWESIPQTHRRWEETMFHQVRSAIRIYETVVVTPSDSLSLTKVRR